MIRLFIFSIVETRLDLAFVILVVSKFAKNLSRQLTKAVKIIFQYFKRLKNRDITYRDHNKLYFKKYLDSNLVGDKKSWKLTLRYIFIFNGKLVN